MDWLCGHHEDDHREGVDEKAHAERRLGGGVDAADRDAGTDDPSNMSELAMAVWEGLCRRSPPFLDWVGGTGWSHRDSLTIAMR